MREGVGGWTKAGRLRAAVAFLLGAVLIIASHAVPAWAAALLHETGFALLVAVIIWVTFDYFSRPEREEVWQRRIEQITGQALYGALRRRFPKELLAEANSLVLSQVFVRRNLTLEYVLEDDTYTDRR